MRKKQAEWTSLRQCARLTGFSPRGIQKAIADGRVPESAVRRTGSGRIRRLDVEAVRAGIAGNTDPEQALKQKRETASQGQDYLAARAKREQFAAELAELELKERAGKLVDAAQMRAEVFTLFKRVRDRMLAIRPRIAPRIAAETDLRKIEQLIDEEVRTALSEMSKQFYDEVKSENESLKPKTRSA